MVKHKFRPKTKENLKALCDNENIYLGDIDTSKITDMSNLFSFTNRKDFSGIETWDTSHVTNMSEMFYAAESFNADISRWNTSNVRNMSAMFQFAFSFNQPIGNWDVSKVEYMNEMFNNSEIINIPDWYEE